MSRPYVQITARRLVHAASVHATLGGGLTLQRRLRWQPRRRCSRWQSGAAPSPRRSGESGDQGDRINACVRKARQAADVAMPLDCHPRRERFLSWSRAAARRARPVNPGPPDRPGRPATAGPPGTSRAAGDRRGRRAGRARTPRAQTGPAPRVPPGRRACSRPRAASAPPTPSPSRRRSPWSRSPTCRRATTRCPPRRRIRAVGATFTAASCQLRAAGATVDQSRVTIPGGASATPVPLSGHRVAQRARIRDAWCAASRAAEPSRRTRS